MISQFRWAPLLGIILMSGWTCTRNRAAKPIEVGAIKQLFLDDTIVEQTQDVTRTFHRPTRYAGNPIIEADEPWETGPGGFDVSLGGGTVLFDEEEQIFKMWYRTSNSVSPYTVCYAVSKDGLHWEKPHLGLYEYAGSTQNNVIPPGIGGTGIIRRPNIIKDYEERDPEKRYKMVYMDEIEAPDHSMERHFDRSLNFGGTGNEGKFVLANAYSRDGIHWRMNVGNYIYFEPPIVPNGVLFGWDPRRHLFVHYHKMTTQRHADIDGRTIRSDYNFVSTTSSDFERWGNTSVMPRYIWGETPPNNPRQPGSDLAAILYTSDLYIGIMPTNTSIQVEEVSENLWDIARWEGSESSTELLSSRDGANWKRVSPHWPFLRPGLFGTWDRECSIPAKPIVHNDQILIYYFGGNVPSAYTRAGHPQYHLLNKFVDGKRIGYAIGLATMRLDGFASMDGYEPGGTLVTRAFVFAGDRLVINFRAPEKPFGSQGARNDFFGTVTVEILDAGGHPLSGYAAADCDLISGDAIRKVVTWRGNSDLRDASGKPIRLKFYLKNAALYAFQFMEKDSEWPTSLACAGCRGKPQRPKQ